LPSPNLQAWRTQGAFSGNEKNMNIVIETNLLHTSQ
jgi:hypothetical protein